MTDNNTLDLPPTLDTPLSDTSNNKSDCDAYIVNNISISNLSEVSTLSITSATSCTSMPDMSSLARYIGEHHWYSGEDYLKSNIYVNDIVVTNDMNGWKYVLSRDTTDRKKYIRKAYSNDKLIMVEMHK